MLSLHGFSIKQDEPRWGVFAQQITGVDQKTGIDLQYPANMVMPATDNVEYSAFRQVGGNFRIVMKTDVQAVGRYPAEYPVMVKVVVLAGTARGDKVLIAHVVAVNKVCLTVKALQLREHEWRNQVSTVNEQLRAVAVAELNGPFQVQDLIVTIGKNGNTHVEDGKRIVEGDRRFREA